MLILFIVSIETSVYTWGRSSVDIPDDSVMVRIMSDSARFFTYKGLDYYHSGDYDSAENFLLKSLNIYTGIFPAVHRKIGLAYNNLGAVFLEHWKYHDALEFLSKAENNFRYNPDEFTEEMAGIYLNRGLIYSRLGEQQKALIMQEMALKLYLKNDSIDKQYLVNIYNGLAITSQELKDYSNAIKYYRSAEKLASVYNKSFLGIIYGNWAICYRKLNDFKKSEYYYDKAIKEYQGLTVNKPISLANTYSNYAELALDNKLYSKAFKLNEQAMELMIKTLGKKNPIVSNIFRTFGRYYETVDDYDSALHYYQKSICSLFEHYNDLSIFSNPPVSETLSRIHLLRSLKDKAGALKNYYSGSENIKHLRASLETYDLAIRLIDDIRLGYQDQESKLFLNENETSTYNEAISVADMLWKTTGDIQYKNFAFVCSEKSKASVLLSALRDAGAKGFGGIPDDLLQKENDLVRDIAFYNEQVYEEKRKDDPDSLKIDLWEQKLFSANEQYDELRSNFENNYPAYYNLKYITGTISVEDMQKKMEKHVSVIEYSLTDSVLYTFLINRNNFEFISQPLDTSFRSMFQVMIRAVGQLDPTKHNAESFSLFIKSSSALYDYLINPLTDKIQGNQLIIVPDGILSFLPFDALISAEGNIPPGHLDYKDLPLLLKKFAVSTAYSSTMLFEQEIARNNKKVKGLLAFAPSYGGDSQMALRGVPRYNYRKDLAAIPGAREEVQRIIRMISGTSFIDSDATETNFKEKAGAYDIIHLAMHTVINNEDPMYSKLVFTAVMENTEDGLLNTREIYNMHLKARMVVLSSCSSGEGTLQKGEGVISLARGFSYAGCPSLIMTLWEIEDRVSADLMVGYYSYLKKGYRKDVALQKAKVDFLNHHTQLLSHPFYWSAYQCIGDTSPLFQPVYRNRYLLITFFSILVLTLIFILIRTSRSGIHSR